MTGFHAKRKSVESSRTTRPAQSKPAEARLTKRAKKSARRTKRIKEPALPRKREVSAASTRQPSRPAYHPGSDDVTSLYSLRNREIVVPKTSKPVVPSTSMPDALSYDEEEYTAQSLECAELGLEHYNNMNQGDEHELVKALNSNAFLFNGLWMHANFLAKQKDATSCVDPLPFFAEVFGDYKGMSCLSCVKMDPGLPTVGGCEVCSPQIIHPAAGWIPKC